MQDQAFELLLKQLDSIEVDLRELRDDIKLVKKRQGSIKQTITKLTFLVFTSSALGGFGYTSLDKYYFKNEKIKIHKEE